jgi:GPH family glycoside/pentoside/hexuronide:cation symporter
VPVLTLRERFGEAAALPNHGAAKGSLRQALAFAFRNRSYIHLAILQVVIVFGGNLVGALGFYITVYYLYGGDSRAAAPLLGGAGTITSLITVASLPLVPVLGRRFGKVEVVAMCLGVELLGSALKWPCLDPTMPWLSLVPVIFINIGNMGFWTLAPSMVSDICDIEELSTGNRREGIYASVTQWMNKLGYTAATGLSGVVLVWIGFSASNDGGQSTETLWWLRFVFTVVPAAAFVTSLFLLHGIQLSRARLHAVRAELERRRGVL